MMFPVCAGPGWRSTTAPVNDNPVLAVPCGHTKHCHATPELLGATARIQSSNMIYSSMQCRGKFSIKSFFLPSLLFDLSDGLRWLGTTWHSVLIPWWASVWVRSTVSRGQTNLSCYCKVANMCCSPQSTLSALHWPWKRSQCNWDFW